MQRVDDHEAGRDDLARLDDPSKGVGKQYLTKIWAAQMLRQREASKSAPSVELL